jgi:hypothetical protein
MRAVIKSERGNQLYRQRPATVEPVFGHTKRNNSVTEFLHRGRTAVHTEWRLLMATHNLAKLHRHYLATVRARNGARGRGTRRSGPARPPDAHAAARDLRPRGDLRKRPACEGAAAATLALQA